MIEETLPAILHLRRPAQLTIPVVYDSPHSGTDYPQDFDTIAPFQDLRKAEDTFVDALYAAAPDQGCTLLRALFPRSYIDPNRNALDLDPELLAEAWPGRSEPGPKSALGQGLIWRRYPPGLPLYDRKLSIAETQQRIDNYHRPYQQALQHELDRVHQSFGAVWHVNCHSMPSLSNDMAAEGAGVPRPDMTLGDRNGSTCAAAFTAVVREILAGFGYRVTINDPYRGAELVRAWSDPDAGRHSLQIEINRGLYMNEETFEKSSGFARLQDHITQMIAAIADFARRE